MPAVCSTLRCEMPVPEWTVVTKAEEPSEQEPLFGSGLLGGVCGFRCEKDTRPSALVKHQLQGGCYCTHEWTLGGKARTVNLHLKAFDAAMSRLILEHTSGVVNHRLSWSAECNWKVPTDVVQTHLRKEFVALLKSIGNTTVAGGSPNWRGVCTAALLMGERTAADSELTGRQRKYLLENVIEELGHNGSSYFGFMTAESAKRVMTLLAMSHDDLRGRLEAAEAGLRTITGMYVELGRDLKNLLREQLEAKDKVNDLGERCDTLDASVLDTLQQLAQLQQDYEKLAAMPHAKDHEWLLCEIGVVKRDFEVEVQSVNQRIAGFELSFNSRCVDMEGAIRAVKAELITAIRATGEWVRGIESDLGSYGSQISTMLKLLAQTDEWKATTDAQVDRNTAGVARITADFALLREEVREMRREREEWRLAQGEAGAAEQPLWLIAAGRIVEETRPAAPPAMPSPAAPDTATSDAAASDAAAPESPQLLLLATCGLSAQQSSKIDLLVRKGLVRVELKGELTVDSSALVATSAFSEKVVNARSNGILVVNEAWLDAAAQATDPTLPAMADYKMRPLHGAVVCVGGLCVPERQELASRVQLLGGSYSGELTTAVTHLVADTATGHGVNDKVLQWKANRDVEKPGYLKAQLLEAAWLRDCDMAAAPDPAGYELYPTSHKFVDPAVAAEGCEECGTGAILPPSPSPPASGSDASTAPAEGDESASPSTSDAEFVLADGPFSPMAPASRRSSSAFRTPAAGAAVATGGVDSSEPLSSASSGGSSAVLSPIMPGGVRCRSRVLLSPPPGPMSAQRTQRCREMVAAAIAAEEARKAAKADPIDAMEAELSQQEAKMAAETLARQAAEAALARVQKIARTIGIGLGLAFTVAVAVVVVYHHEPAATE